MCLWSFTNCPCAALFRSILDAAAAVSVANATAALSTSTRILARRSTATPTAEKTHQISLMLQPSLVAAVWCVLLSCFVDTIPVLVSIGVDSDVTKLRLLTPEEIAAKKIDVRPTLHFRTE